MEKQSKIFIAGHEGIAGSAIFRKLKGLDYHNIVVRTINELDLRDQKAVEKFFENEKPEFVFLAAENHGGIHANNVKRAEFIYDNLMIQANVINQSYIAKVKKLINVSSSVVYDEDFFLHTKQSEDTIQAIDSPYHFYSIAKLAGITLCQAYNRQYNCRFISAITPELYNEYCKYDSVFTPVLPSLVKRIFDAKTQLKKTVEVWGTGTLKKEFLNANDLADACVFLMNRDEVDEVVNIGPGDVISIHDLADLIKNYIGFKGELYFNPAKPDDRTFAVLDCSKISRLGWLPKNELKSSLRQACYLFEHEQNSLLRRQPSTSFIDV